MKVNVTKVIQIQIDINTKKYTRTSLAVISTLKSVKWVHTHTVSSAVDAAISTLRLGIRGIREGDAWSLGVLEY